MNSAKIMTGTLNFIDIKWAVTIMLLTVVTIMLLLPIC